MEELGTATSVRLGQRLWERWNIDCQDCLRIHHPIERQYQLDLLNEYSILCTQSMGVHSGLRIVVFQYDRHNSVADENNNQITCIVSSSEEKFSMEDS